MASPDAENRFPLLAILGLLSRGLRGAGPLPDRSTAEDVRRWARDLLPTFDALCARTITVLDSATASAVRQILECDFLWQACWNEFHKLPGHPIALACAHVDEHTGSLDPALVTGLVEAVRDLANLQPTPPPAPPARFHGLSDPLPADAAADAAADEEDDLDDNPTEDE